jgi:hypothetical protein
VRCALDHLPRLLKDARLDGHRLPPPTQFHLLMTSQQKGLAPFRQRHEAGQSCAHRPNLQMWLIAPAQT